MLSANRHGCYSASYRHTESVWLEQPPDEWETNDNQELQSLQNVYQSYQRCHQMRYRDTEKLLSERKGSCSVAVASPGGGAP